MSEGPDGIAADAAERLAIGISFGNSNSSIAFIGPVSDLFSFLPRDRMD
jgi:molecular chaperone DnaK (HSP70)